MEGRRGEEGWVGHSCFGHSTVTADSVRANNNFFSVVQQHRHLPVNVHTLQRGLSEAKKYNTVHASETGTAWGQSTSLHRLSM